MQILKLSVLCLVGGCAANPGDDTGGESTSAVQADDRAFLQALLDRGGDVTLPAGNFVVGQNGRADHCLHATSTRIHGAGQGVTTITVAGSLPGSVSLLKLDGDGASLDGVTLDGNKAALAADEHRHGVFAQQGDAIQISNITARNFTGDGVYLYVGLNDAMVTGSIFQDNDRNGVTMGADQSGTTIANSQFFGNRVQPIDSEPKGEISGLHNVIRHVTVTGNTIEARPNQFAVTVSGRDGANHANDWLVSGNTITGGIYVVWADAVTIADNDVTSPDVPPVTVERNSFNVTVARNRLRQIGTTANLSGVYVVGTSSVNMPSAVTIADNTITVATNEGFGVRADGTLDVTVTGNTIAGPGNGTQFTGGVRFRATILDRAGQLGAARGNTISGFNHGVIVGGNTVSGSRAALQELDVEDNAISCPHGIGLDSTNLVPSAIRVLRNRWSGTATPHVEHPPAGMVILASDESF